MNIYLGSDQIELRTRPCLRYIKAQYEEQPRKQETAHIYYCTDENGIRDRDGAEQGEPPRQAFWPRQGVFG